MARAHCVCLVACFRCIHAGFVCKRKSCCCCTLPAAVSHLPECDADCLQHWPLHSITSKCWYQTQIIMSSTNKHRITRWHSVSRLLVVRQFVFNVLSVDHLSATRRVESLWEGNYGRRGLQLGTGSSLANGHGCQFWIGLASHVQEGSQQMNYVCVIGHDGQPGLSQLSSPDIIRFGWLGSKQQLSKQKNLLRVRHGQLNQHKHWRLRLVPSPRLVPLWRSRTRHNNNNDGWLLCSANFPVKKTQCASTHHSRQYTHRHKHNLPTPPHTHTSWSA